MSALVVCFDDTNEDALILMRLSRRALVLFKLLHVYVAILDF